MRLCQPYLRALGRGLVAIGLLSGVVMALWLVAALVLAQIVDSTLAGNSLSDQAPQLTILAIAAGGAALLGLARTTLLNRRAGWVHHGLSELVLAHELWRGADIHQRDRSLAAAAVVGRFVASPSGRALTEAPWAMAILGGLWLVDLDLAAVANAGALVLGALALAGSRVTPRANQFHLPISAAHASHEALCAGRLPTDASLDQACAVAGHWEATQRGLIATTYAAAQSAARRRLVVLPVLIASIAAMAWLAQETIAHGGKRPGGVLAVCLGALLAQLVVARWALDARHTGMARAAVRHLVMLRIPRTRQSVTRLPAVVAPDLRAPLLGAWLMAATSIAGVAVTIDHWHVPLPAMSHNPFAARAAAPDPELARLGVLLAASRAKLAALQSEAGAVPRRPEHDDETAELTRTIAQLLKRIAELQPAHAGSGRGPANIASEPKDHT